MTIQVLFFGATASVVGARRVELSIPDGSTSDLAFECIRTEFPKLNAHNLLYSVNQSYAFGNEVVSDGDELAVFTPVSGG